MFSSRDISIFVFLWNPQTAKYVMSSNTLLHNGSYAFAYLFWILSTITMKFGHILVYLITNICNMFLAQCWRLELLPGQFTILMKWHYNETCQLGVDIYHFQFSLIPPFQKNKKLETWRNWFLSNWSRLLNWKESET